jgi:ABC-type multidrug transport system permease subunit
LIPFVFVLDPPAWLLGAAVLVLAQIWFFHYADVFGLGGYVWLVLIRDVLALALFGLALRALHRRAVKDEDAVLLEHQSPLGTSP